ncbi:MAG: branched-chain amino acid transaminase [Candidatus Abyssobacteria bacterium SURF_17]|uniref:Branched-chain-amino-acid aminotransferase n=1 Tax=Candidatus Abyssobacteria bacterium SURF_17 TaxID=2093361 RepID=A0A419F9A8_9BACT|nr:MAG: branched-chain amino acid transaminase [Candidatus Abyssubacteria bacterium SURF_17]
MEYGKYAYFEGKFVPIEDAKVSIMTHAFNYGTGVFEGIRGYWNSEENQLYIFKLKEHYVRMFKNFNLFHITLPITMDEACRLTVELARRNEFRRDMYIRPIAYKSSYEIGPRVHNLKDDFAIFNIPLGDYVNTSKGLNVMVSSWRRVPDNCIPARSKAIGIYINSALAATEAKESGFDEAIMLTQDGFVSEGSAMNLFVVRNGQLITTPVTANILEGVTRQTIIEIARDQMQIETDVRPVDRTELYIADELFFCGTGAQVAPITMVDRRPVGTGKPGELAMKLQSLYFGVVQNRLSEYSHWLTPVY